MTRIHYTDVSAYVVLPLDYIVWLLTASFLSQNRIVQAVYGLTFIQGCCNFTLALQDTTSKPVISSVVMKDVLLIGYGAIGAICKSFASSILSTIHGPEVRMMAQRIYSAFLHV